MKRILFSILFIFSSILVSAQDFSSIQLKEVNSGKSVAIQDKVSKKGSFIFFVDDTCPFVESYANRLKEFSREQSSKGYSVIFVNPHEKNNPSSDNLADMKKFFNSQNWAGSYFSDPQQELVKLLGATKLPEVFFVKPSGNKLQVLYQGAIDNNPQNAAEATNKYLQDAVNSYESGAKIQPTKMPAMGCRIKRF